MRQPESSFHWANLPRAAVILFITALLPSCSLAQQPGQKTFSSAEEASKALLTATQNNDEKAILDILGPDGKQVVSSGDDTEDAQSRANFAQKFQEMHRLMKEPDGTTTLYVGAENWPTPIPLVNKGKAWYFDTAAGKKEVLYRRVGENEISTIFVCQQLAAAQKEYRTGHGEYAPRIFSDEGQHNGLYWKGGNGEPQSPIGPLVASAVAEGYRKGQGDSQGNSPAPFHGYYFHTLTRQGAGAHGGAKDYMVNGKMMGGFAFVAYPAEYRSSGVMTFIVGPDGVVYRKDLGPKTEVLGNAMKEYNPDPTWHKEEDQQEQSAVEQETK